MSSRLEVTAVVVAAFVCRCLTIGRFETIDEVLWMTRSQVFSDAITKLHPASASVTGAKNLFGGTLATMPGVPTMWLGSIARLIWGIGRSVGLWSGDAPFRDSQAGLTLAQLSVAVATSLLIGLIVWLMARWAAPRAALVAGILLATEPFWVAHGSVIHTDELTALFGVSGLLALALVLGVPNVNERYVHRTGLAVAAGVLLICSPLTKVSGLGYGPAVVLVVVWAAVRQARDRPEHMSALDALRPAGRVVAIMSGAAIVTVIVLWPAIWADPVTQFDRMRDAVHIGYTHQSFYFRGRVTRNGSPAYYLVALPLRMTPWMYGASLLGIPLALVRRITRTRALVMLLAMLPIAYTLSAAEQQVDRYGLLVLGPLCVVIGLVFMPATTESPLTASRARVAILAAGALATVHAVFVAPWGLAYYNPALGGGNTATKQILVGWNEGQPEASERIAELEHHNCRGVTVAGLNPFQLGTKQCGLWVADPKKATYLALYISYVQILSQNELSNLVKGRTLVATVTIRDIDYVTIWRQGNTRPGQR